MPFALNASGGDRPNSPTSLPAVNRSPSPRISTTRTVGSFSAPSIASASAPYIALVSAFFLSGRAMVRLNIPPRGLLF